jgi:hypothetical protein
MGAITTTAPGCQAKGIWGIPAPKGSPAAPGLPAGVYFYTVTAVLASGVETTPCPVQTVGANGTAQQDSAVLQWNAVPGAAGYRIYRGNTNPATPETLHPLIFAAGPPPVTALPPAAVCPPGGTGTGPRCVFQDNGGPTNSGVNAPAFAAALTAGGKNPDLRLVQCVDYGNADQSACPITNPAGSDDPTTDDPSNATPPALKTDVLHFPPGLLANPSAAPACKLQGAAPSLIGDPDKFGSQDPDEDTCSPASLVGTAQTISRTAGGTVTLTSGDIYIGETKAGDVARLFLVLRPACSAGSPVAPGSARCTAALGAANREVEKEYLAAKAGFVPRGGGAIDVQTVKAEDDGPLPPTLNVLVPAPPSGNFVRGGKITVQVRQLRQDLFGVASQGTADTADDKPFMALPTACPTGGHPFAVDKTTHDDANVASATTALNVTECTLLPFAPKVTGSVGGQGRTGPNQNPDLDITISQAVGEAATKVAKVTLPDTIGANLTAIAGACTEAQLAGGTCPAIGSASASTPILPTLTGTVHIVQSGAALPKLVVILKGAITLRLDGTIDLAGGTRLVNLFSSVPDVPLTSFTLHINGGPGGLLRNTKDLCDGAGTVDGDFTAHSTKTAKASSALTRVGTCAPRVAVRPKVSISLRRVKSGKPVMVVTITRGSARRESDIRKVTLTLPRGLKTNRKKARSGLIVKAGPETMSLNQLGLKSRVLSVLAIPGGAVQKLTATMSKGSLRSSGTLRRRGKATRATIKARVTTRDGKVFNYTLRVRPKS